MVTESVIQRASLEGFSWEPPRSPWGINFGGGLNSTAVILRCIELGYRPDWILFADTGSEFPGTLEHVERVNQIVCSVDGWPGVVTVRWERVRGEVLGFEPLHVNCLRTRQLPSKAYGLAGCTTKWKIQPMDRWRKERGFQGGAFAVGYDAGEKRRINKACKRGDDPDFLAWYPLVAWGIDRAGCEEIVTRWGLTVGKSSCFMCPNLRGHEWAALRDNHPELFETALLIEELAVENGHFGRGGKGLFGGWLRNSSTPGEDQDAEDGVLEDRCHHGGCFT